MPAVMAPPPSVEKRGLSARTVGTAVLYSSPPVGPNGGAVGGGSTVGRDLVGRGPASPSVIVVATTTATRANERGEEEGVVAIIVFRRAVRVCGGDGT